MNRPMSEAMSDDLQADLELLRDVAAQAAKIGMAHFGANPKVMIKGDKSPVSEADLAIDAFAFDMLTKARPDYGWLSEERPDNGSRHKATRTFILDPIDGTRAFIDEKPEWCVSIGLVEGGRPIAGVLNAPVTHDEYFAARGKGAFLNDKAIAHLGDHKGHDPHIYAGPKTGLSMLKGNAAIPDFKSHPYIPSLALRLAYVATGKLDATLVRANSAFWDTAAADLIVEEAGGRFAGAFGDFLDYGAKSVKFGAMAAARPAHFSAMIAVVRNGSMV